MESPARGRILMSSAGLSAKNVPHLFEERLLGPVGIGRIELFDGHRLRQFLEQVLLFLRQLLRDGDLRDHIEIADAAARDVGHSLAPQLEPRPGLRPRRYLDLVVTDHRRHTDLAAQREHREGDRQLAVEIVAFPVEECMLLHVDDDVEVSRRTAGAAVLAFAVQAQALPRGDARRNFSGDPALPADASGAAAGLARLADHAARPAAGGAGTRDGEEALLETLLSGGLAVSADFGRAARRRARALARLAGLFARNLDGRLGPGERLLEGDLEVVAQIRAPLRSTATAASAEDVAEAEQIAEIPEDVLEARERVGIEPARADAAHARMPEAIVHRSLLGIRDDRIGLGGFLEVFLGFVIARVPIRVVFQRELPVRALDLLVAGVAADAEDLVVVALAHALATFTIAGRSRRSPSMYPRRNSSMISPSRRPSAGSYATAWWKWGSKSCPRASIGLTPRLRSVSCRRLQMSSTPRRMPSAPSASHSAF